MGSSKESSQKKCGPEPCWCSAKFIYHAYITLWFILQPKAISDLGPLPHLSWCHNITDHSLHLHPLSSSQWLCTIVKWSHFLCAFIMWQIILLMSVGQVNRPSHSMRHELTTFSWKWKTQKLILHHFASVSLLTRTPCWGFCYHFFSVPSSIHFILPSSLQYLKFILLFTQSNYRNLSLCSSQCCKNVPSTWFSLF